MKNLTYILFPLALLAMLTGMYIGFIRIGWVFPVSASLPVPHHGILMAGSFLGTLISVERVYVLKSRWVWLIPTLMISSLVFMLLQQNQVAFWVLLVGSIGYLIICAQNYRTYKLKGDALLLTGAFFQIVAFATFMLTHSYPISFAGWLLFFLFTIVGERLNLTRFLPVPKKAAIELYIWFGVLIVSSFLYHFGFAVVVSLCLWGVAQWLLRNDIALINIKRDSHYKFLGAALIGAYIWLFITGGLGLIKSDNPWLYDALLHAFFVGFVLSMVLAHAPIIFPGLLQIRQRPFHPVMYFWLIVLHASLFLRIYGDLSESYGLRKWGGLFNGVSFVGYLLTIAVLIINNKIREKS